MQYVGSLVIRFIGDPSTLYRTMAEENRASTSTTVNSVSLKLPPFWTEQPTIWFAQTEAQFVIRNINVELTKFYHVVAALDGTTAQRVSDILEIPPRENPYSILKKRLTNAFALADRERAAQILELNDLGDMKPSALMDHLLCLVGDRSSEFLVREVFLRSLPDKISIVVAASTSGLRDLALEADRHFSKSGMLIATAQPTVNKVHEPTPEVHASFRPRRAARNSQPAQTGLCYYHAAFGAAARNCCAPCAWVPSSNQARIPGNARASDRL